jgi:hypothetical protein
LPSLRSCCAAQFDAFIVPVPDNGEHRPRGHFGWR